MDTYRSEAFFKIEDQKLIQYTGNETEVRIPQGIKAICDNAFKDNSTLKRVVIADSVVSIMHNAFFNCKKLKSIDNIGNVTEIGNRAFFGCTRLERICLNDNITSIGKQAFFGCKSLKVIRIPTALSRLGSGAFDGCPLSPEILLELEKHYKKAEKRKNPSKKAFTQETAELTQNNDTRLITRGNQLVKYTGNETIVTIPLGIDEVLSGAFFGKDKMAAVIFCDDIKVIHEKAFSNCKSLRIIAFEKDVATIEKAFVQSDIRVTLVRNESDRRVVFPRTKNISLIETDVTNIKEKLLLDNALIIGDRLVAAPFDSDRIETPPQIRVIEQMAFSRRNVKYAVLNEGITTIGNCAFDTCGKLVSICLPKTLSELGEGAFRGCTSLRQVVIPNGVKHIKSKTFCNCSRLEMLVLPKSIESVSQDAIFRCEGLKCIATASASVRELLIKALPQYKSIII